MERLTYDKVTSQYLSKFRPGWFVIYATACLFPADLSEPDGFM